MKIKLLNSKWGQVPSSEALYSLTSKSAIMATTNVTTMYGTREQTPKRGSLTILFSREDSIVQKAHIPSKASILASTWSPPSAWPFLVIFRIWILEIGKKLNIGTCGKCFTQLGKHLLLQMAKNGKIVLHLVTLTSISASSLFQELFSRTGNCGASTGSSWRRRWGRWGSGRGAWTSWSSRRSSSAKNISHSFAKRWKCVNN